jgi:hypothetical protein
MDFLMQSKMGSDASREVALASFSLGERSTLEVLVSSWGFPNFLA